MTGGEAIVECIKREGIDHVFCVQGESYLAIMDAIYDESGIQLISTRHENGAGFMAEAYAKATGKPGVAMATRAVGGANLSIAVHTARQDSTPLVVFLGQVHSGFRGREGFQEVDLARFFAHTAKWAVEVRDVHRIPEIVQRAFRVAKTGRPGPVVVALPEDVTRQKGEMVFSPAAKKPAPRPSVGEIDTFRELLNQAHRPVMIAGGGVIGSRAEEDLTAFAEKFRIPVVASFRRQDVFPNNHPLYAGHSGLGTFPGILDTVRQADIIIAVGTRLSEITTQGYTLIRSDQILVHIDIEHETLGKVYPPHLGITADAKEALRDLATIETDTLQPRWLNWAEERGRVYQSFTRMDGVRWLHPLDNRFIIHTLQKRLPSDAILTNDAGNFSGWLHSFYQFNQKRTYIGPTSGAMGYGLPAAIGAKLAHPDQIVVALTGDGGFTMTMNELETAVRYRIPVICLVFNNHMYGTIRMHQEKHYPNREIGTSLTNLDFLTLGQSLDLFNRRVEKNEEFEPVIQEALTQDRPALIEIQTDPGQISVQAALAQLGEKWPT